MSLTLRYRIGIVELKKIGKNKKRPKTIETEKYISFPGFSIIKDRVIKPLLIATEKVVEYYFPEEKQELLSQSHAA